MFDKGPAQHHLLSTNLGFFGSSRWTRHGFKESSAEFVAGPCSTPYQLVASLPFLQGLMNPLALFCFCYQVYREQQFSLTKMPLLFDRYLKSGLEEEKIFEDIFKQHGAAELYPRYRHELSQLSLELGAGLLHLFIPDETAKRWCYLSAKLGQRMCDESEGIFLAYNEPKAASYFQARALLHPEFCTTTNMQFYAFGEPEKIMAAVQRLYQIAEEVKHHTR